MLPAVYCLPWTHQVPVAFAPTVPHPHKKSVKSPVRSRSGSGSSSSNKESECTVTLDSQEGFNQVLLFTDGKWPKEYFDVEIDVSCQVDGNACKLCTLTQNQRCFMWSETDALPKDTSIVFTASFKGPSLNFPKTPEFPSNPKSEGQKMQEINEKTPEVTFLVSSSPTNVKGKRKVDKENVLSTPKLKSRRQQVAMRAAASAKKSPLNKTHQNHTTDKSSIDCLAEIKTATTPTKITKCVNLSSREPRPSSRWGHTMCMVDDNMAVLVGGQGDKQQFCRDSVWMLNPEMRTWKSSEVTTEGVKPELRVGHTATYDPTMRCIYIFGGSKKSKWFHDVYMFDLDEQKWDLVKANGKAPTRAYHSATLYRHELWMFGGVYPRPAPQPDASDNEIHIFSPMMEGWYKPIVTGEKPLVRSGHTATLMNDYLVVFGGWDFPYCYNDLHILDLTTVDWSAPKVNGNPPKPRSWHSSSDLSNNRLFIHGGYDGDNALQDAFIYNLDTHTWNELVLNNGPTARAGHTCIRLMSKYEKEDEDEIIIFGGGDNDDSYFSDMLSVYIPHQPVFA